MLNNKFELDPIVVKFATRVADLLDKVEDGVIDIKDFSKELDASSDYKNKALTLGFLFTHITFYKKDLNTPWSLKEIMEIINANPEMLDLIK